MKKDALVTRNVVHPLTTVSRENTWPEYDNPSNHNIPEDHFVERNGVQFAGTHLILDLWGAKHLDDLQQVEKALRDCVKKSHATLLHIHLHRFSPSGGISGVAVLAESHISVHTWPEREFAAFDIFMCGDSMPDESITVLKRAFFPAVMKITENLRGMVENE